MVKQFDAGDVAGLVQRGMGALSTTEGLEALWTLVGRDVGQAAVLPVDGRWAVHRRRRAPPCRDDGGGLRASARISNARPSSA
jgi:hypothetical protein